ncbi:MAG TPA: hypothetical protein VIG69_06950 [Candidatus Methylomirabilis sp.]|jgi:hypothetical protein
MDTHLAAATSTVAHTDPRHILALAVLAHAWATPPEPARARARGSAPQPPAAVIRVIDHLSWVAAPPRGATVNP